MLMQSASQPQDEKVQAASVPLAAVEVTQGRDDDAESMDGQFTARTEGDNHSHGDEEASTSNGTAALATETV